MTRTTREKTAAGKQTSALEEASKSFMPHGRKTPVSVEIRPTKKKTMMRESALLFYQRSLMPARNALRRLVGLLS